MMQYPDICLGEDEAVFSLVFQESFKFDNIDFDVAVDYYISNDSISTQRKSSEENEYDSVEKYLF